MKALQKALLTSLDKIGKMKVKGLPRAIVIIFLLLLIAAILLFIGAWCWQWANKSITDFPALQSLISIMSGGSFIMAIGFFGKALIDKDDNQIPDVWEADKKEGDDSHDLKRL